MKAIMTFITIILSLISVIRFRGLQDDFPVLKGPYLGQKSPGMTPEIFAPGLVSKEGAQAKLNISPDMNEIIYWERDRLIIIHHFMGS